MEKGDQAINAEALFLLLLLLSRAVLNGLRKELPEERIRWLKPQFFDVSFFSFFMISFIDSSAAKFEYPFSNPLQWSSNMQA